MTYQPEDEKPVLYLKQIPCDDPQAEPFWSGRLHPNCFAIDRSFYPPKEERFID